MNNEHPHAYNVRNAKSNATGLIRVGIVIRLPWNAFPSYIAARASEEYVGSKTVVLFWPVLGMQGLNIKMSASSFTGCK
jgi:hypothetical protein